MSVQKSPLRDRLLSNSPDPIKSSIMRDSGMGWISPASNTGSLHGSGSSGSITSPLRIAKRDSPRSLPHPPVARRSSSSFKHVRNNNLVSKSPFKSQIPTHSTTPARPISFPSPRRVSGEKRPRPTSIHDQGEDENDRPFALKRERKQSKTFQGLIQREPVTKSPFKQQATTSAEERPLSPPPPLVHLLPTAPAVTPSPSYLTSSTLPPSSSLTPPAAVSVPKTGVSPGRSSLVSRRMHGPRLDGGNQSRRQRRKTVTWDEKCDVVEISGDEHDTDSESVGEQMDQEEPEDDPFFRGGQPANEERMSEEVSYEANDLSDTYDGDDTGTLLEMGLDTDASISGLVDEMFASSSGTKTLVQPHAVVVDSSVITTSTPPRQGVHASFPPDTDTEGGIPLGRSHHAARFIQHNREYSQSPKPSPPPFFTHSSAQSSPQQLAHAQIFNLPTHASPHGPPATPPRRSVTSSPATQPPRPINISGDISLSHMPPLPTDDGRLTHLATPPLGRSTHAERAQSAKDEECADVWMLPGTPSPTKAASRNVSDSQIYHQEGLIPKFGIDIESSDISSTSLEDPFSVSVPAPPPESLEDGSTLEPANTQESLDDDLTGSSSPATMCFENPLTQMHGGQSPRGDELNFGSGVDVSLNGTLDASSNSFGMNTASSRRNSSGFQQHQSVPLVTSPIFSDDMQTEKDTMSLMTTGTDISLETAVIEHAERKTLTGAKVVEGTGDIDSDANFQVGFGNTFGHGLDFQDMEYTPSDFTENKKQTPSIQSGSSVKVGDVDVDMEMRSALDRLMDDVAGTHADDSLLTDEGDSYEILKPPRPPNPTVLQRAATETALLHNNGFTSRNVSVSSGSSIPPPPPPKDNIKNREQMILEKRREAKRLEYGEPMPSKTEDQRLLGVGRPSRRRSMSTSDAEALRGGARSDVLLDVAGVGDIDAENGRLGDSIEQELKKMVAAPVKHKKQKYQIREHQETIYASSSDADMVSHLAGPGDVNVGKAWRPVRRPSDMNEFSKQIKEYRAQEKSGKAYGKVFVKVVGVKNIDVPLPPQPTSLTCTLNNGIHFVTTPECQLSQDFCIEQEFELVEHNKLEFTLTLKVRRDPHIIAQFKELAPPPPKAPVAPPPVVQSSSSRGMRSFFSSSPKKSSKDKLVVQKPPPPSQTVHRLPENLARYLKPDGTMARAFISFKDIAPRCDTRLFETSYPLIGQRAEDDGKFSTLQVGEIVLQIFRLPPLPGIAPEQLPQSLEECHRGLRHINWHKVTYFEGILTQSGGDCSTWRRRQLRVIGANVVAFNDVTKKATATIDLKQAIAVEDDQEIRNKVLNARSSCRYEDDTLYGVERSFRLIFPHGQEILFFADTDEEKARWLDVLRALVGHIPPHPFWAELLWQRQDEVTRGPQPSTRAPAHSSPSWLLTLNDYLVSQGVHVRFVGLYT
ncbi:hypothetical protein H0H92_007906 [Tricholoma furcatifolium]|nr:hypothetical protein H0H92_007906 [Tricholoma furcatifolium]